MRKGGIMRYHFKEQANPAALEREIPHQNTI
jgi:hypothetical protein